MDIGMHFRQTKIIEVYFRKIEMPLKLEMLRSFAAVARHGNLSDAAATLGRTPSAVSMMLKQLEAHLDEPLFETDRKNKLTALGRFVLEQAERELQQFDNTVRAIEGFAKATHGQVRIATVPSVAGTLLPRVLSQHMRDFDQVDLQVRDMDSESVVHELLRNRIDLGIATLPHAQPGIHSQPLLRDGFGVVCPQDHPLALGSTPLDWLQLQGHRLISNSLSALIEAPESLHLHRQALLSAHNLTSIMAMVHAGIGVTILPEMAVTAASFANLTFRPLADPSATRQLHLLRRSDLTLSPAAKLLEQHILNSV
jgi:DNA-binding transcriptional LysR family regulator